MTGLYKVVRCSNLDDPEYVEKALSLTEYTCGMTRSAVWLMSGDVAEQIAYELNETEDGSGPHFWRAKPADYVTRGGMEP